MQYLNMLCQLSRSCHLRYSTKRKVARSDKAETYGDRFDIIFKIEECLSCQSVITKLTWGSVVLVLSYLL